MESKMEYGKYHGNLKDPNYPKNCTEQQLYFTINMFGGFIWRMNHELAHGRIQDSKDLNNDLILSQYAIEYCVFHTTRFGVEIPELKDGEHVVKTESYMNWFNWWDNYFQKELKDEEFKEYDRLLSLGKDVSSYRPKGDWKQQN